MLWNYNKDTAKTFSSWLLIFNAFVPTHAVAFCIAQGQNNTRKGYTEGFVPLASLIGVFGLLSLFIRSLIGSNGKM